MPMENTHLDLTPEQCEETLIGVRLRRNQLRKQADDLPTGMARQVVRRKIDTCTQVIALFSEEEAML